MLALAAKDERFLAIYDPAIDALDAARSARDTWWHHTYPDNPGPIAYFSAEFALHQSLPIYAGGLGVLAGDHCKEASDLGIPLIGVGFMYPQGYFHQMISPEGWQQEVYERLNWADAPVEQATLPDGKPCIVAVPLGNRSVLVSVWKVRLGRVKLYLLDTDLEENAPWDRELSARLYGGDRETRIQQEIILGIGGVRALKALEAAAGGLAPQRRPRRLRRAAAHPRSDRTGSVVRNGAPGRAPDDDVHDAHARARGPRRVSRSTWSRRISPARGARSAAYRDQFLALGHYDNGSGPLFNMTALALRTAGTVNGVSELHGQVTREMWGPIWPGVPDDRRPVGYITNGVHVPTWISSELARLFDDHIGGDWRERHDDPELWAKVREIPDEELWGARNALRQYLFAFIRERARLRWKEERVSPPRVVAAGTLLDPNALTLGFARRFTGYKRPELIFHNPERLMGILNASRRPVQIVFAGKAHPADETGKHHLQQVYRRAIDPMFGGRIAFVDDYDLHVAHFLVQGCDVWLNNPRKPLEASGTSGMKASINGVPHCSIGDGWWAEGFNHRNGWLIEGQAPPHDPGAVDAADADALYNLLETEIVPAFYDRDTNGIPRRWLQVVREAIISVTPRFSARRMVKQYAETMYGPATRQLTSSR